MFLLFFINSYEQKQLFSANQFRQEIIKYFIFNKNQIFTLPSLYYPLSFSLVLFEIVKL